MKKIFKQISRPFQYASKVGENQKTQTSRQDVGGNIINSYTSIVKKNTTMIAPYDFKEYLKNQGVPQNGIKFLSTLEWVLVGESSDRLFQFNKTNSSVEFIKIGIKKLAQDQMKVVLVWKKVTVEVADPQTIINYSIREYGLGWRNSHEKSETIKRDLTGSQNQAIMERLQVQLSNISKQLDLQSQ